MTIGIIPTRRGSKSIPGKNHKVIAGKPLAQWVIQAAADADLSDVVVATDDPAVEAIADSCGVSIHHRSPESATDTASTELVLHEVLDAYAPTNFVLLQATSPLTTAADINQAVDLKTSGGFDSVLSVAPQTRFVWERTSTGDVVPWNYVPTERPRRQDCEPVLVENGALYVSSAEVFHRTGSRIGGRIGAYEMQPESYFELDEPSDWEILESLLLSARVTPTLDGIRLVLSDVDGVLTDNGMYWSSNGDEMKRFSARDGKGFELLHNAGIKTALITSESLELVQRRAAKLGCHAAVTSSSDKVADAEGILKDLGLRWDQVAFVGDDVHDLPLLRKVRAAFSPADAAPVVARQVDFVTSRRGGHGCFREVADLMLRPAAEI